MTKENLIDRLKEIAELDGDPEVAHVKADEALLKYIDNQLVTNAYNEVKKWYA